MSDLINKSALIEEVQKYFVNSRIHRNDLAEILANLPTVEAKPVIHGKWKNGYVDKKTGNLETNICTACGKRCWLKYDYCPNCGADMRKKVEQMTVQEIENTLYNLRCTLEKQRHLYGDDNNIRVRMGRELIAWINGYNKMYIMHFADDTTKNTIFGYPLEIDYDNVMCLEVHFVEGVYVDNERSRT